MLLHVEASETLKFVDVEALGDMCSSHSLFAQEIIARGSTLPDKSTEEKLDGYLYYTKNVENKVHIWQLDEVFFFVELLSLFFYVHILGISRSGRSTADGRVRWRRCCWTRTRRQRGKSF